MSASAAVAPRKGGGAFLFELGRTGEAREAFDRAIALANSAAEAAHIRGQIDRLTADARAV